MDQREQKIQEIENALNAEHVDSYISLQFRHILNTDPNADLNDTKIPLVAEATCEDIEYQGIISRMGKIYALLVPLSDFPDLTTDSRYLSFEASR